jgi:hypothetical protein
VADGQLDGAIQKLQLLFALWYEKRGICGLPSLTEIASGAFESWRDHIALIDLGIDDPIRFRQCGPDLGIRFGIDMTNRSLAELDNDDSLALARLYKCSR